MSVKERVLGLIIAGSALFAPDSVAATNRRVDIDPSRMNKGNTPSETLHGIEDPKKNIEELFGLQTGLIAQQTTISEFMAAPAEQEALQEPIIDNVQIVLPSGQPILVNYSGENSIQSQPFWDDIRPSLDAAIDRFNSWRVENDLDSIERVALVVSGNYVQEQPGQQPTEVPTEAVPTPTVSSSGRTNVIVSFAEGTFFLRVNPNTPDGWETFGVTSWAESNLGQVAPQAEFIAPSREGILLAYTDVINEDGSISENPRLVARGVPNSKTGTIDWEAAKAASWYVNLSQAEMAKIAGRAQRLNKAGEPIPFNTIEQYVNQVMELPVLTNYTYGVVLERPYIEGVPVIGLDGRETIIDSYVVPYMIQDKKGKYHVSKVIIGSTDSKEVVGVNSFRGHGYSVNRHYRNLPISEIVYLLTPNTQHLATILVLNNVPRDTAVQYIMKVATENPDISQMVIDNGSYAITYSEQSLNFLNKIKNGEPVDSAPDYLAPGAAWDINTD